MDRTLIVLAAAMGLAGVALSAAAAHLTGGGTLETSARFLLLHAPVLLAVVALVRAGAVRPVLGRVAAFGILVGVTLFSGDLALRALQGFTLHRLAAPTGGVILMAGWALLALAALLAPRRPPHEP